MSKKILQVVIFSFVLIACGKNEPTVNSVNYSYEYSTLSKIKITIDTFINEYMIKDSVYIDTVIYANPEVIAGENYVFKYLYEKYNEPGWVDGEYYESILLEIPVSEDNFLYDSDGLKRLNTAFEYYCYCSVLGLIKADSGTISGIKIDDNNWKIELNARFSGEQDGNDNLFQKRFSISEIFKKDSIKHDHIRWNL